MLGTMSRELGTPSSPAFRMADHILGGQLVERLRQLRGEQRYSYERIAQDLGQEGVATTATSIAAWCAALGIEKRPITDDTPAAAS